MKPIVSLLALSVLITTGTVIAADPPATKPEPTDHSQMQHGEMDHSKMDHSKPVDHQKMAADEFAALDKNKDGKLIKAEVPPTHPLAAHFGMLDADKNGSLNQTEFAKHHGM